MKLVPITLREANAFVVEHHRHHPPARGCRFCLGAEVDGRLVAVAVVARPRAKSYDPRTTCEVVRLASDGTRNACSFLYGAVRRVAQAMGFLKTLTYTLASEPGSSLRAAGFRESARIKGRSWSRPKRERVDRHPLQDKIRWEGQRMNVDSMERAQQAAQAVITDLRGSLCLKVVVKASKTPGHRTDESHYHDAGTLGLGCLPGLSSGCDRARSMEFA